MIYGFVIGGIGKSCMYVFMRMCFSDVDTAGGAEYISSYDETCQLAKARIRRSSIEDLCNILLWGANENW